MASGSSVESPTDFGETVKVIPSAQSDGMETIREVPLAGIDAPTLRSAPGLHFDETVRSAAPSTPPDSPPAPRSDGGSLDHPEPSVADVPPGPSAAADREGWGSEDPRVVSRELRLALRVNFNHLLIEGHPTTFQMQIENLDPSAVDAVMVELFSSALAAPVELNLGRLGASQSLIRNLEIEPRRAGAMVLTFAIKGRRDDEDYHLRGETVMRVLREPERKDNIQITIKDLVNFNGTNAGLGAELEKVDLGDLLEGRIFQDFNALVEQELPDSFATVALELDYTISRKVFPGRPGALSIPRGFLQTFQSAKVLRFIPVTSGMEEFRVVTGPRFVFGRSGSEVDFLAWFWPRSERNDEATRRISKLHAAGDVRGGQIWFQDLSSTNGTFLDGGKLSLEQPGRFTERALLRLGLEYDLEVRHDEGTSKGNPQVGNVALWSGPAVSKPGLGLNGAVRFVPRSCEGVPRNAVWLFTDASFGRSRSNPLQTAFPGVAEVQGRVHHWRENFWIEQSQADQSVAVDGHTLSVGEIVPLKSGQRIQLGSATFRTSIH